MFDFDAGKLIIIGIVALIVIGPKDLPRVMRQVGQAASKMRRMAGEFRAQFMDAMHDAEVDAIKSDVAKLSGSAMAGGTLDPLAQIKAELTQAIDRAETPAASPAAAPQTAEPPHPDGTHAVSAEPEGATGSFLAMGTAPLEPGTTGAVPVQTPPAAIPPPSISPASGAIDAEMRALADALAAEMGEAAPRRAAANGEKPPAEI